MLKKFLTVIVCLALSGLATAKALAVEFSADMYTNGMQAGKVYIKGSKTKVIPPGNQQYIIGRQDKNTTYIIMPGQKMYMEQKFDPRTLPQTGIELNKPNIKKVFLGKETVNGKSTKKYKITAENNVAYHWYADGLFIPVKIMDLKSGTIIEYKNISSRVPDSVFELPAGYKKMQMPSYGMQNMQQVPQQQMQNQMQQQMDNIPGMNKFKQMKNLW